MGRWPGEFIGNAFHQRRPMDGGPFGTVGLLPGRAGIAGRALDNTESDKRCVKETKAEELIHG